MRVRSVNRYMALRLVPLFVLQERKNMRRGGKQGRIAPVKMAW